MLSFIKKIYCIPIVYKMLKKPYHFFRFYFNSIIPLRDIIILESAPDLSDNTKVVFDEMIRRGLNKRYKFVWRVNGKPETFKQIENVIYLNRNEDEKLLRYYYRRAKLFILCNEMIEKYRLGQKAIYLTHSTTFKSVKNYFNIPPYFDKVLTASKDVIDLQAYEFNFDSKKAIALGFPRNDELTENQFDLHRLFNVEFEKIIVWYPTFRQHRCGAKTAASYSLPIIHDMDSAKELNETAVQNKVLIVLKPHFAQDVSLIKNLGLSNIVFIDDDFYKENEISSYQFVGSCDALVSDYSSVYFDFTLCDKPVALVWEDIEEYKRNPGLIDNYEFYASGGQKIYTLEEMKQFVVDVAKENDILQQERRKIRDYVNYSIDGKNSKRVTDYIIKEFKL